MATQKRRRPRPHLRSRPLPSRFQETFSPLRLRPRPPPLPLAPPTVAPRAFRWVRPGLEHLLDSASSTTTTSPSTGSGVSGASQLASSDSAGAHAAADSRDRSLRRSPGDRRPPSCRSCRTWCPDRGPAAGDAGKFRSAVSLEQSEPAATRGDAATLQTALRETGSRACRAPSVSPANRNGTSPDRQHRDPWLRLDASGISQPPVGAPRSSKAGGSPGVPDSARHGGQPLATPSLAAAKATPAGNAAISATPDEYPLGDGSAASLRSPAALISRAARKRRSIRAARVRLDRRARRCSRPHFSSRIGWAGLPPRPGPSCCSTPLPASRPLLSLSADTSATAAAQPSPLAGSEGLLSW